MRRDAPGARIARVADGDYNRAMFRRRKPVLRFLRPALGLAFVLAGATAAGAQGQDRIDPAQIRFITPTAATSTCIGKPTTPMCGIETLIGCSSNVWNEACHIINSPVSSGTHRNVRVEYVIVKAGFVNPERVRAAHAQDAPDDDLGRFPWLTEDAFQAVIFERECPAAKESCDYGLWRHGVYTIAPHPRIAGHWLLSSVSVYAPESWFVD